MEQDHKSEEQMHDEMHAVADKVNIGGYYRHYKNGLSYRLLGLGFMESDDSLAAIYQAQYGGRMTHIRPLADFIAQVDGKPRFKLVEEFHG